MKKINNLFKGCLVVIMAYIWASCSEETPSLGAVTIADFKVESIDSNTIRLVSTATEDPFVWKWDVQGVGQFDGAQVEFIVPKKGIYPVTHTVLNQGGHDTAMGQFEIEKDIELPCVGTIEFLTSCTSKTWQLSPEQGCLWVGPDPTFTWWEMPASGPVDRPCLFNDKWIFGEDGSFEYDAEDDVWGEQYMGISPDQCVPELDIQAPWDAWTSGMHSFEFIPATADHPDQIKVVGLGAFIGIPKPTNTGEVSAPVTEITYDILSTSTQGGHDYMQLEVDFGGGIWRYILKS